MSDAAPASGSLNFGASKVGSRLRAERERRGIGLRELARRVGVSPSLVSQIELDRVNPSVSTLYALVTELGMTMTDVFGDPPHGERVIVQSGDGLAERPETRQVINLASGVRWERLTPGSDRDVEFLYVVYPVGAASCPEDALMTHGGKEYGYVTSGTLGSAGRLREVRARAWRVDRVQLVVPAPAMGDRRRARARGLGGHRPRGRSPRESRTSGGQRRGVGAGPVRPVSARFFLTGL